MNKGIFLTAILFSVIACNKSAQTNTNSSSNIQSQECKGDAVEIAARVITNINAGRTDYFYKIDLKPYNQKGCDKELIQKSIKAML